MTPSLVLASSYSYRRSLLARIADDFICADPAIDEQNLPGESAEALVQRLALGKAKALQLRYPEALIIGSDQVASLDGQILGKPGDFDTAKMQLQRCSGRNVRFLTGLCLLDTRDGHYELLCEPFAVTFRQLEDAEIETYLRREQPYDCAGSFKSEGLGICLFEGMEGKDPNTLIGLPLITLATLLRDKGINPLL